MYIFWSNGIYEGTFLKPTVLHMGWSSTNRSSSFTWIYSGKSGGITKSQIYIFTEIITYINSGPKMLTFNFVKFAYKYCAMESDEDLVIRILEYKISMMLCTKYQNWTIHIRMHQIQVYECKLCNFLIHYQYCSCNITMRREKHVTPLNQLRRSGLGVTFAVFWQRTNKNIQLTKSFMSRIPKIKY